MQTLRRLLHLPRGSQAAAGLSDTVSRDVSAAERRAARRAIVLSGR